MKTNGIVVVNLHGVLIDEQWAIYQQIQQHWSQYCGYLKFPSFISHDEFIKRKMYDVCNAYMLDNYKTKASYIYGIYRTQSRILKNIIEDENFYKSCELLNFAKLCILKSKFIESSKIKKVIILIDKFSDIQAENAKKFCEEVFDHPKISILTVEPDQKWKFVSTKLRAFSLYMDHSITNIAHIAESLPNLETAEFLIPRYEFNKMPLRTSMLIHGKSGAFTYYSEDDNIAGKNIL